MVDWAFSWLYNESAISTCLSGMSTLEHVQANIKIAEDSDPGYLSLDELNAIDKATGIIKRSIKVPCTACQYCMPCPNGVDIPGNFTRYNDYFYFEPHSKARKDWIDNYNRFMDTEKMAKNCIQCGECDPHCPQKIVISEEMPKVAELFKK